MVRDLPIDDYRISFAPTLASRKCALPASQASTTFTYPDLARVGQSDGLPTEQDHREWMAEEIPFQAGQRPWERADLIICGTPQIPLDPATDLVIAPPIARSG